LALISFHQERNIRDLTIKFNKLESAESVDSAQTATATSHKDWLDIKSAKASVQKGLSNLFSSGRAQKAKLLNAKPTKSYGAFMKYYRRGEQGKQPPG
jgi:hypothetical protein